MLTFNFLRKSTFDSQITFSQNARKKTRPRETKKRAKGQRYQFLIVYLEFKAKQTNPRESEKKTQKKLLLLLCIILL